MHFKGTLALLAVCLLLGCYVYFYEIRGGEKREKAKESEGQLWKVESRDVQQIDLLSRGQLISAKRQGENGWVLTAPRTLDADSDELNRLANSASNIRRENVVEADATDLSKFGLSPAQSSLKLKMKNGKEYAVDFGYNNPTGSSAYAVTPGKKEVFLVTTSVVTAFDKKPDELRNQTVLAFDPPEAQTISIKSSKGNLDLEKDANDRWWIVGKERIAADSPGIRGILNALSMGRIKEFFNDPPDEYRSLGFDNPTLDVRVTVGKNKAIKHLVVGAEKPSLRKKTETAAAKAAGDSSAGLYLAKDESRPDLFFVDKELVDKLLKTPGDVRDKALAAFQRWDVDFIALTNPKGNFSFTKAGGEWYVSGSKNKAKWDSINAVLDAMEKPVKQWIDQPAPLSTYGLEKPLIHVVLKQGGNVLADCSFGKSAKDGIYAQVKGESSVKIADPEGLSALDRAEADYVEAPPAPTAAKSGK